MLETTKPSSLKRSPTRPAVTVALTTFMLGSMTACLKGEEAAEVPVEAVVEGTPNELQKNLAAGMAVPQEELARFDDTIKVSGEIIIEGYTTGRIQIDVVRKLKGPQRPVTTARFDKTGPFTLLLPPKVGKVEFIGILDFDSDGPDKRDPRSAAESTVEVGTSNIDGIVITIDKDGFVPTPPLNAPPQPNEGEGASGGDIDTEDGDKILLVPDE